MTEFWNQRAALGERAGTDDLIAAELERRAIAKYVQDGMRVLDVGCGNGTTALWLRRRYAISIWGIDSAPSMIREANAALWREMPVEADMVAFSLQDVTTPTLNLGQFNLIYTQRCLINLPTWEQQGGAIERILSWLKPGGAFLVLECCHEGLDGINELRAMVDLPAIRPPSHNRYFYAQEISDLGASLERDGLAYLAHWEPVCPTYALISRVLNAALAAQEGKEPQYDAAINRLALKLPAIGNAGQNRMWVFRRFGSPDDASLSR